MNAGLGILIARMQTNPEEFGFGVEDGVSLNYPLRNARTWDALVYQYRQFFTQEDINAYEKALKEMQQEKFTQAVLERLTSTEKAETRTMLEELLEATKQIRNSDVEVHESLHERMREQLEAYMKNMYETKEKL